MIQKIKEASDFLRQKIPSIPHTCIVLGSGLGSYADNLEEKIVIDYAEIPHFSKTSVTGHAGRFVYGKKEGTIIGVFQGRFHFYEGHSIDEVVLPIRVMAMLGVHQVLLTNASGGINANFKPGDLVIINDHINIHGINPLIGKNLKELGERFPDMSTAYDPDLVEIMQKAAKRQNIELPKGVYAWMLGPSYETPAEIRMLRTMGADLVGMSTVPEVIAAHHAKLKVGALACVTNLAAGIGKEKLSHAEVKEVAKLVENKFANLLTEIIKELP